MGKWSRRKGAEFEVAIAHALRRIFPDARRRAMQARGGSEGADIDCTPGWWIECGFGRVMSPAAKLEQAIADLTARDKTRVRYMHEHTIPVAITKRNRGEVMATMRLEDWIAREERLMRAERALADAVSGAGEEEERREPLIPFVRKDEG